MSKRTVSWIALLMMMLTMAITPAIGNAEEELPHLEFTVLALNSPDTFFDSPLVTQAMEKFNFSFDILQVGNDTWAEQLRTLAATGSLPEVIAWYYFNYGEYKNWVEQEVLAPLPDLAAYPNLKALTDSMDVTEYITVDGKLYAFPRKDVTQPFNSVSHTMFLYRRDWALAMGYDFAPVQTIAWDDLVAYCKDLKEKDPGGLGENLVPFDTKGGALTWLNLATQQFSPYMDTFYLPESGDSFVWGPRNETAYYALDQVKALYDAGLFYPEAYADGKYAGVARMDAGMSGLLFGSAGTSAITDADKNIRAVVPDFPTDGLGIFAVTQADGKYHTDQMREYYHMMAFAADARPEVIDRWLMVGDWLMEDEQMLTYAYGEEGVDWQYTADGAVETFWELTQRGQGQPYAHVADQQMLQKFFITEGSDHFLQGNPTVNEYVVKDLYEAYFKTVETDMAYTPSQNYQIAFFSGDVFDQYGTFGNEPIEAFMKAVMADDAHAEWDKFVAQYGDTADQIIAELNAAYLGK